MIILLALLAACSHDKAPADDGSTHDSGVSDDTSVSDDSGVSDDTGATVDTATRPTEDCTNGEDDDLDGLVDCEDGDCWDACIEVCGSGEDEDQDGLIDCEDDDCADEPACKMDPGAYRFRVNQGRAHLYHHWWLSYTSMSYSMWSYSSGSFAFDIQSGTVQNSGSVRCGWTGALILDSNSFSGLGQYLYPWFQTLALSSACPFHLGSSVLSMTAADLQPGDEPGDPARWTIHGLPGMSPTSVVFPGLRTASFYTWHVRSASFQLTQTVSWTQHLTAP